jgi:hypothetical protein
LFVAFIFSGISPHFRKTEQGVVDEFIVILLSLFLYHDVCQVCQAGTILLGGYSHTTVWYRHIPNVMYSL